MGRTGRPVLRGNERFYRDLEIEMREQNCSAQEAEISLLHVLIMQYRCASRHTHDSIAKILGERYGFAIRGYYKRLKEIRKTRFVP